MGERSISAPSVAASKMTIFIGELLFFTAFIVAKLPPLVKHPAEKD
jgi:hypothetical protein